MSAHNIQCPVHGCGVWSNRWGKKSYPLPSPDVFIHVATGLHNRRLYQQPHLSALLGAAQTPHNEAGWTHASCPHRLFYPTRRTPLCRRQPSSPFPTSSALSFFCRLSAPSSSNPSPRHHSLSAQPIVASYLLQVQHSSSTSPATVPPQSHTSPTTVAQQSHTSHTMITSPRRTHSCLRTDVRLARCPSNNTAAALRRCPTLG
jgi:hypothetical protein